MKLDELVMVGRTDLLGVPEEGLEIPIRTRIGTAGTLAIVFLVGAALVAFGVVDDFMIVTVIGIGTLLAFAYMAVTALRTRSVRLRLVLTPTGIVYEHPLGSVGVRWSDVQGVGEVEIQDIDHLGIGAPGEAVVQRGGSKRLLATNRALSGAAISVPFSNLPGDRRTLIAEIADYARDPSPLREPERERAALAARLA